MIIRKLGGSKPKILLFQGSPRTDKSCSGQISKSEKVCDYLLDKWSPFVDFEYNSDICKRDVGLLIDAMVAEAGQIIAEGTPEELVTFTHSHTGIFLKAHMEN